MAFSNNFCENLLQGTQIKSIEYITYIIINLLIYNVFNEINGKMHLWQQVN
jgi:hypothetical protein